MSLEFQLATEKAVANLKALDTAIAGLQARFGALGAAEASIAKVNADLAGIKGIDPNAAQSITAVANALNRLGKNNALSSIAQGLSQLSSINVSATAASLQHLSQALSTIKAPTGLSALGNNLAKIGNEARIGLAGVQAMAQALNNIRAPAGLNGVRLQLAAIPPAAAKATSSVRGFGSAMSTMSGVLAAFGVQSGVQGLVNFGKESIGAAVSVDQFKTRLLAAGYTSKETDATFAQLSATTDRLALPIESSIRAYGKLASSMSAAGMSAGQTMSVFTGFGTAFRAMGLDSIQVDRAFNAINQTFSKGKVSAEELRQQLGEVFPAFTELAASMGVSTASLDAMMEKGEVTSAVFLKLADDLQEKFAVAAEKAGNTGQAAMIRFSNAVFTVQAQFGKGFLDGAAEGINRFTAALKTEKLTQFAGMMGQLAGGALTVMSKAIDLVTMNTYTMGAAVTVLGGIAGGVFYSITAYLLGMIPGAAMATTAFTALGAALVGLAARALGLAATATALQVLSAGFMMAASAALPLIISIGSVVAVGTALAAVGALVGTALATLVQWFQQGGSFGAMFAQNLTTVKDSAINMTGELFKSVAGYVGYSDGAAKAAEASKVAAEGLGQISPAATDAAAGMTQLEQPTDSSAQAMSELQNKAAPTASAVGQVGDAAGNAAGSVSALTGSLNSSVGASNSAASAARNAAQAFRELANAKASAGAGGGGGGGGDMYPSQAGGGYAASPTRSQEATASAFRNAPHFAGGTANTNGYSSSLAGGGIPSILHPNEAVVPLAGGGTIPISVGGGGGGAPQSGPDPMTIQLQQLSTLRDMNTELNRIWESIDANSIVLTNEFSKQNVILNSITGALNNVVGAVGQVNLTLANMRVGGSTGGGGTGGSTGSTSGGTSGALIDAIKAFQTQRANLDSQSKTSRYTGTSGMGYINSDGKVYASYDVSPDKAHNDGINAQKNNLMNQLFDQFGVEAVVAKLYPNGGNDQLPGVPGKTYLKHFKEIYDQQHPAFAIGSPNAAKDASGGGFTATLHPDEAVIPLPDGRTVPVELPRSFMDRTLNDRRDGGSDTRRPTINVTMHIQTPDANSFRASQQQVMDKLRGQLERTARTVGPAKVSTVEDPTRRV